MSIADYFMRMPGNEWLNEATCWREGHAPSVFDNDIWSQNRSVDLDALDKARSICARCPVRAECGDMEMQHEVGLSGKNRYVFFAGLTPAQRAVIEQRGDWTKDKGFVDRDVDPIQFNSDYAADGLRVVSERGEDWDEKHTAVARELLGWIAVTMAVGQILPPYRTLARQIKRRDATVRRVLEALVEDGMLRATQKGYVLVSAPRRGVVGSWLPLHEREESQ